VADRSRRGLGEGFAFTSAERAELVNRRTPLVARCLGAALASTLVIATALIAVPSNAKVPRAPHRYSSSIEPLAGYSPQRKCSPWAKPGTTAFANLLLRTYRSSRSLGIVRSCGVGGTSEHKEGRAFDWGVSIHRAQDRRAVRSLMRWLLQRDRHGNRYAMARRLGIQYMIWNRRIWGSYSASSGWRRYTGSNPHTDHVHFSLSWKGARKKTSFWRPRRFGTDPTPTPTPKPTPTPTPTPKPTPTPTPTPTPKPKPKPSNAIPEPRSPRTLPRAAALRHETVAVPARRRAGVYTKRALRRGHSYLVEAAGTYRYAPHTQALADPECSTVAGSYWSRDRSVRRAQRYADHLDLYVDGHDMLSESDNGQECDTESHTYRWIYQPYRSGRVPLKIWDPTRFSDNAGRMTVRITDLGAVRNRMTWQVPSKAAAGATSPGSLRAAVAYQVTVKGRWTDGGGMTSDAECSRTTSDRVWRRERSGDHDLLRDREGVRLEPLVNTGEGCNTENHHYRFVYEPDRTGPVNFRVTDPGAYADNSGEITVRVVRYVPPTQQQAKAASPSSPKPSSPKPTSTPTAKPETERLVAESLSVVSTDATAVRTRQTYPAGTRVRLTARGRYRFTAGGYADAECTSIASDRRWRPTRLSGRFGGRGRWLGDLTVNGVLGEWLPSDTTAPCDERSHTYTREVTVDRAGRLAFVVADDKYTDNLGTIRVTVAPR
jgi:hypothetical protein